MENPVDYRITTVEHLRTLMGEPHPATPRKLLRALDDLAVDFIRRAPFMVLGTADAEGNQDVSPKGGAPGFVAVEDRHTLLIPDRKGNKLLFGLQNVLANPHVGLIFMVPGTDETLRVNGAAELSVDPAILSRLSSGGSPAQLAIRVHVRECFFHCAKALIRSQLWKPESWSEKIRFSWGRYLATRSDGEGAAEKIDRMVELDYKNNL
ncbi:MAG TPA: MSMEG_1061 family FMN-dependent PPOX-type flavoprotein [Candidatus Binataceae bacterium]|nr:MSMEG_1061 family FMN-dependent PPOX-type flavoprotein [Candidatus Binataceae bacterium]